MLRVAWEGNGSAMGMVSSRAGLGLGSRFRHTRGRGRVGPRLTWEGEGLCQGYGSSKHMGRKG